MTRPCIPPERMNRLMALAIAAGSFLYVLLRSYFIPLSFDEAITFLNHATRSFQDIVLFKGEVLSNNHLLNTLFIKIFTTWFGVNEFILRLPALIGFILYLIGCLKILRLFENERLFLIGLCFLIINPALLEIFSAARGYALELGFFMWALYYFLAWVKGGGEEERNLIFAVWFLTLGVLSHLVLLPVYASFVVVVLGWKITEGFLKFPLKRFYIHLVGSGLLLAGIFWTPVRMMRQTNEFGEGGTTGFWADTVKSLIDASLYGLPEFWWANVFIQVFICLSIVAAVVILLRIYQARAGVDVKTRLFFALSALLIVAVGLVIVGWSVVHVKYVTQRRAYYFLPLFWLFVVAVWTMIEVYAGRVVKFLSEIMMRLMVIILVVCFVGGANLQYFYICPHDAEIRQVMRDLGELAEGHSWADKSKSIAADWLFFPTIAFYKIQYHLDWLDWPARLGVKDQFDFYVLLEDPAIRETYGGIDFNVENSPDHYRIIKRYPTTSVFLAVDSNFKP